jgi:class 3 adenylate cyclase
MIEPRTSQSRHPRLEAWIEATDRPLVGLAVAAIILYLLDVRGLRAGWLSTSVALLSALIDVVFALDLVLKLVARGRAYTRTPWFLIDLLSSLPLLDTITFGLFRTRVVRVFRLIRALRILRGLRVLRVLHALPLYEHFYIQVYEKDSQSRKHRLMNIGLVAITVLLLVTVAACRRMLEREYLAELNDAIAGDVSLETIKSLGGSLVRPDAPSVLTRSAVVNHRRETVYFDLRPMDAKLGRFEFFLTLGMMFALVVFLYVMGYSQLDVTHAQLRVLLNLALPRQVAEQFLIDPSAYTRKSRTPATILFMDLVGFTQTCEFLAHDPDRLAIHLESALDRLVEELTRHDMIIDKFIGDAVMAFRGGPLVEGDPTEHARRSVQAALDSIEALAACDDPYFSRVKIGGASAEDCLIGAFGTRGRLTYTILGDGVNLAARLEPACGQCATQNLFDEATYLLTAELPEFTWRCWGWIRVEGKSEPIRVYEAFDSRRLEDPAFIGTFEHALEAFEHHDFDRARDLFLDADSQREGGDHPSRVYAHRCEDLILRGRPVGWEPVFETHK